MNNLTAVEEKEEAVEVKEEKRKWVIDNAYDLASLVYEHFPEDIFIDIQIDEFEVGVSSENDSTSIGRQMPESGTLGSRKTVSRESVLKYIVNNFDSYKKDIEAIKKQKGLPDSYDFKQSLTNLWTDAIGNCDDFPKDEDVPEGDLYYEIDYANAKYVAPENYGWRICQELERQ